MTGGFLNLVFKVWNRSDQSDPIIVRVFTNSTETIQDATKNQLLGMRIAEAGGCGPEVIASFGNGIIYAYTHGDTLDPAKYDSNEIRR